MKNKKQKKKTVNLYPSGSKQIRRSIMIPYLAWFSRAYTSYTMLKVSSLALGLSMPPQCIMLLMAPSNGLVGAGSHLAARSWVSPELAAQPAATHSRSSLRFLLRACCPGKNQGILYTSLHGVMGVNQENMMKYEKCQNVLRTSQNHSTQWVPVPRCLNWARTERLPVDLTNTIATYGNRFSSDNMLSDNCYLYLTCTWCAIIPPHWPFVKIDSGTVI